MLIGSTPVSPSVPTVSSSGTSSTTDSTQTTSSSVTTASTTTSVTAAPTQTTSAPVTTASTTQPSTKPPGNCHAIGQHKICIIFLLKDIQESNLFPIILGIWTSVPGMDGWCESNCNAVVPNCPQDMCRCGGVTGG